MEEIEPGYIGNLSPEQKELMLEMRKYIKEELKITDRRWNNWTILRFCRARKFDREKVKLMINNFLDWAKEMNLQELGNIDMEHYKRLRELYIHGYYHTDKTGRPVYIEKVNEFKPSEIFKIYPEKELMEYHIQSYERLLNVIFPACSFAYGKRIEKTLTIMDLKGVNTFKLFAGKIKQFVQIATKIAQDYYPEVLGNMYIINSGYLFAGLWALVKPWIDVKTQKKIIIKSGSGKKDLLKVIDEEKLPEFLGGTCKDLLVNDPGPFNAALTLSRKNKTLFHDDKRAVEDMFFDQEELKEREAKENNGEDGEKENQKADDTKIDNTSENVQGDKQV